MNTTGIISSKTLNEIEDAIATTLTLYLRKDERSLDMRYKSNRDYFNKYIKRPWYDKYLQRLANILGSPVFLDSPIHWSNWLNPKYHLEQLWYKWKYRNGIQFSKWL